MTLFVLGLGLYPIARRLLPAYLLFFPLAVLSKETAILFLPVALLGGMGRGSRRDTAALILYHVAVFVGLKAALAFAFQGNAGVFVAFKGAVNLGFLSDAGKWGFFATRTVVPSLPLVILVLYRWKEKPVFLRQALLALGIPMVLGCSLFGSIGELRTYYEFYPVAALLAVPAVAHAFGWDAESAPTGAPPAAGPPLDPAP
jgi:hypothetical protein